MQQGLRKMKLLISVNSTELHKEMQPHYVGSHVRHILITSISREVKGEGRPAVQKFSVTQPLAQTKSLWRQNSATVPKGLKLELIGNGKSYNPREEALGKFGDLGIYSLLSH